MILVFPDSPDRHGVLGKTEWSIILWGHSCQLPDAQGSCDSVYAEVIIIINVAITEKDSSEALLKDFPLFSEAISSLL